MKVGNSVAGVLLAALFCICACHAAFAQDSSQSPSLPDHYIIQPEDVIEIFVWPYPELSMRITVRPDGMISFPFLGDNGEYKAAGKTVPEIVNEIKARAEGYLKDPRISINITNFRLKRAFVLGAVAHPGVFEIRRGDNVMDLITRAGGFTDRAKTSKVALINPPKNMDEIAAQVIPDEKNDKKSKKDKKDKEEAIPDNIKLIDVAELLGKGRFPAKNVYELDDGYIVFVPTGNKIDWAKLYGVVTTVYSAFRIDDFLK